jgi:type IV pilus assembly protein PilO
MPRSFNLRSFSLPAQLSNAGAWKEPRVMVRLVLGLLLIANLVAAGFAFNIFGPSPEGLNQSLVSAEAQLQSDQGRLTRTRVLASKIGKGKTEGDTFLANYFTSRRYTYSTVLSEIREIATTAGMKTQEGTLASPDPIEGTDELSMVTISINFEGTFPQLVKFVNLLDRSPRFLIIESMQAAPQPKGDILNTNFKLHVFVKDDLNAAL